MEEGISTMVLPVGTPKSLLSHFAAGTILAANLQEAVKLLSEVPASSPTPQFKERSFNWPKEILLNTEEKLLIQCFLVGGHPTILLGPPGVGKTTLAHAIKILRNRLSPQDMVEVAKVYAIAERPTSPILENTLIPWRAPHHSSSREGLLGGGQGLLPGELSLAHKGILFLDEGLEFSRHFWQSLREPLEEGVIRHARAGRSLEYPAQISLLISANPCACGSFGSENQTCLCSSGEIQQYWKKIGGPMRDRLAIRYWMNGGGERAPLQNPLAFVEGIEKAVKRRLRIPNTTLQEYLRKNATYREIAQIEDLARTLAAIRGGPAVSPEDQATAHSLRTGILGRIPWF
jgi:predicted ATPase with chaperone activity